MIQLSQAAANEIKRIQTSQQKPNSYFRLGVKPGGCSGWHYTLELEQEPKTTDFLHKTQELNIIIDLSHQSKIEGLKIDYAEDLMGGGFRFDNPNASSHCSCSQSFSI